MDDRVDTFECLVGCVGVAHVTRDESDSFSEADRRSLLNLLLQGSRITTAS